MGNLRDPNTALAAFGILTIAALRAWNVRAAILIGILATTRWARWRDWSTGSRNRISWSDLSGTMLHLNVRGAMGLGLLEIVFVFLFVDLFDNIGTLMAVTKKAGLLDKDNKIPRVNRILFTDATATIAGSLLGTTTVVSYIECAAGVAAGGRSGVTSVVTGLLFVADAVRRASDGSDPAGGDRARSDRGRAA